MVDREPSASQSKELEIAIMRELALKGLDAVAEVLEGDVTIAELQGVLNDDTASLESRRLARRALRSIKTVATNSRLMEVVGSEGVYHFTEAVILYSASDKTYIELAETLRCTPEEVTGLYALRELIAAHTDGRRPSFTQIFEALKQVALSIHQAAIDPDSAVQAFDDAGFFTDHSARRQFNNTIFSPSLGDAADRIVDDDSDGSVTRGIKEGMKESLRKYPEERGGEEEAWGNVDEAITNFLKNLD